MNKLLRSTTAVLAAIILFTAGIAYASPGRTMEVTFLPGVKFVLNGKQVTAGNHHGMYVEGQNRYPNHVMYNGTIYVPLRFVEELTGKSATWNQESRTVHINDRVTNTIKFNELNPEQAPPAINHWVQRSNKMEMAQSRTLGNKTYLLVTRGEKLTGGYGVSVTRVEDRGSEVVVTVRYTEPTGMVTQAITYPLTLVEIPRVDKPVRFVGENGRALPQLPINVELQPVINGTANIKLYALKWGIKDIIVSGIANVSGAKVTYEVRNQHGSIVQSGNLNPVNGSEVWSPFTINIPRADFGGGERVSINITRTLNNGTKETFRMSVFQLVK